MVTQLNIKKITGLLALVVAFLALAHILGQIADIYTGRTFGLLLFDMDRERSIPTFYSAVTLLFCSGLLLIIASATKKKKGAPGFAYWMGLAVIFFVMSLDEAAAIHENFIAPLRSAFNATGFFYFAWVIPASIFLVVFLSVYLKFLVALPRKIALLFIVGGAIYVGGALGFELLGGYQAESFGTENTVYAILITFEETLEMIGTLVFIYALLLYITLEVEGVHIKTLAEKGRATVSNLQSL